MTAATGKTVLIAGATGLVGSACLRRLLADPAFARVRALVRRPIVLDAPKLEQHVVDFAHLADHAGLFDVDAVICALGTTIRQAGSQERFRQVDHDYPLQLARLGLSAGAQHFLLVSALGADAKSAVFYNRVKGELEQDVLALPYPGLTIVRPSLLLGERREFRLGEEIGKRIGFLVPGKYKPVAAEDVAAVLVAQASAGAAQRHIIESPEIRVRAARVAAR